MNMELVLVLLFVGVAVVCYLIGSINFAIMITRKVAHTDVRAHGSGNAGMTNVLRTAGKKAAAMTYICDFLKGFACAAIGRFGAGAILRSVCDEGGSFDPIIFAYFAGIFCMLGHIFPIFFEFRGGKGVAALSGVLAVCGIGILACALSLFIIVVLLTRIVSISSLIAAVSIPIFTAVFQTDIQYTYKFLGMSPYVSEIVMSACFTLIIVLAHIPNIKRLVRGEEKAFGNKK
jgi:glycerol-3-phosphate acyltransferase PlsY